MHALRCTECGDTRWSFRSFAGRFGLRCELCGGRMVPERRMPSQGPAELVGERRDRHSSVTITATRAGRGVSSGRPPVGR